MSEPRAPTPGNEGDHDDEPADDRNEQVNESEDSEQFDDESDAKLLGVLAGLKAPPVGNDFSRAIEDKINKRSAGRFFGQPTMADRVWIGILALIILTLGLGLFWLMRGSDTGSLKLNEGRDAPKLAPGAREALPRP